MAQRVAMIEDEADLLEIVAYAFRKEGYDFRGFSSGREGVDYLRRNGASLLLLDIMLPDEDGIEICRSLRKDDRLGGIPIIFVTAKGEEVDRVLGLEMGADDYVVKPFSPRELVARVKAVLRRHTRPEKAVESGDLVLNEQTHDVVVRGEPVVLSALEFRLLYFLAAHPRQVFTRERLLDEIWGGERSVTPRTVDVHIRRLREKIERQPDVPEYIGTVRGVGYRFIGNEKAGERRGVSAHADEALQAGS